MRELQTLLEAEVGNLNVCVVGVANVGKSTLVNALKSSYIKTGRFVGRDARDRKEQLSQMKATVSMLPGETVVRMRSDEPASNRETSPHWSDTPRNVVRDNFACDQDTLPAKLEQCAVRHTGNSRKHVSLAVLEGKTRASESSNTSRELRHPCSWAGHRGELGSGRAGDWQRHFEACTSAHEVVQQLRAARNGATPYPPT